jgi:hypothetical protein
MKPNIAINKQRGENNFVSSLPNDVFFTLLKKPMYLNSPIALKRKIAGIIQLP